MNTEHRRILMHSTPRPLPRSQIHWGSVWGMVAIGFMIVMAVVATAGGVP